MQIKWRLYAFKCNYYKQIRLIKRWQKYIWFTNECIPVERNYTSKRLSAQEETLDCQVFKLRQWCASVTSHDLLLLTMYPMYIDISTSQNVSTCRKSLTTFTKDKMKQNKFESLVSHKDIPLHFTCLVLWDTSGGGLGGG